MTVTTATRAEYLGFALEAEIRSRIHSYRWYRAHRDAFPWADLERENALILRDLFRVRRDALRAYQAGEAHVLAAWRELKVAHDAAWAAHLADPEAPIVDVPLALTPDAGDHFRWPA